METVSNMSIVEVDNRSVIRITYHTFFLQFCKSKLGLNTDIFETFLLSNSINRLDKHYLNIQLQTKIECCLFCTTRGYLSLENKNQLAVQN